MLHALLLLPTKVLSFLKINAATIHSLNYFFFFFFVLIRLGNARGRRNKNVWKGKLLKLKGSARRKKRLVREQHVKLKRKQLPLLGCGKKKPGHLVLNLKKDLMLHR